MKSKSRRQCAEISSPRSLFFATRSGARIRLESHSQAAHKHLILGSQENWNEGNGINAKNRKVRKGFWATVCPRANSVTPNQRERRPEMPARSFRIPPALHPCPQVHGVDAVAALPRKSSASFKMTAETRLVPCVTCDKPDCSSCFRLQLGNSSRIKCRFSSSRSFRTCRKGASSPVVRPISKLFSRRKDCRNETSSCL